MPRTNKRLILILIACLTASLALVACGSDDTGSAGPSTTSVPVAGGGSGGTVDLADNQDLGQILVDADGRTLYLFEKDDEGDESYCSGACAKAWPPLTIKAEAQAGGGLDASKLTTFKRDDGTTQVAYADHPLYYYAGDQAPGDANGNELDQFGAEWYALTASGATAEDSGGEPEDSGEDDSSDDSGSSGGYTY